jgi:hypothetical protein
MPFFVRGFKCGRDSPGDSKNARLAGSTRVLSLEGQF